MDGTPATTAARRAQQAGGASGPTRTHRPAARPLLRGAQATQPTCTRRHPAFLQGLNNRRRAPARGRTTADTPTDCPVEIGGLPVRFVSPEAASQEKRRGSPRRGGGGSGPIVPLP